MVIPRNEQASSTGLSNYVDLLLQSLGECVPKFCPNCGARLVRVSKRNKIWVMPLGDTGDRVDTFDVYCDECEWSGHVSPDSLDIFYDVRKQVRDEE